MSRCGAIWLRYRAKVVTKVRLFCGSLPSTLSRILGISLTKQRGSPDDDDDGRIKSRGIKMYTNDKGLNNRAAMKSILPLEDGESSVHHGSRAANLLILYY